MRAGVLLVLAALSGVACMEPGTTECGDITCPAGLVCAPGDRCVAPDQLGACEDVADGEPCSFTGTAGTCVNGVCVASACGNGVLDDGEVCDDGNTSSDDDCRADCLSDLSCGNGVVDPPTLEACDCGDGSGELPPGCSGPNADVVGATCRSDCRLARCGDGVLDASEQCEGTAGDRTCEDVGHHAGTLGCSAICQFDTAGCGGRCGDGILNGDETCDGSPPDGVSCVDFGYDFGALPCSGSCGPAVSACETIGWQPVASPLTGTFDIVGMGDGSMVVAGAGQVWRRTTAGWTDITPAGDLNLQRLCNPVPGRVIGIGSFVASFDGTAWTVDGAGPQGALLEVACHGSEIYVALGDDGTIRHFDGVAWSTVDLPPLQWGALFASGADDVWALGIDFEAVKEYIAHFDGISWSVEPVSAGGFYTSLWGTGPDDIHAVGFGGAIAHWDGAAWSMVPSPTSAMLIRVRGRSATDAWATGAEGTLLHWDGWTWTPTETGRTEGMTGIWPDPAGPVWVGMEDTAVLLRTDGMTWRAPSQDSSIADVRSIWIDSGSVAFAAGSNGINSRAPGDRWRPTPVRWPLNGIGGSGPGDIWAVGDFGLVFHWDGSAWTQQQIGADIFSNLVSVWSAAPDFAFVLDNRGDLYRLGDSGWLPAEPFLPYPRAVWGSSRTDVFMVGEMGSIWHYDGVDWTAQPSPTTANLRAVWGRSGDDVYAVGDNGVILHFDGVTWSPAAFLTAADLYGVAGDPWGQVTIVGADGTLLRWKAWTGWEEENVAEVTGRDLLAAAASPGGEVIIGGEGVLLSQDPAGYEWEAATLSSTVDVHYLSAPDPWRAAALGLGRVFQFDGAEWWASSGIAENVNAVWPAAAGELYLVTDVGIYYDGGTGPLLDAELPNARALWGFAPDDVYALGDAALMHFDGTTWSVVGGGVESARRSSAITADDVYVVTSGGAVVHFDGVMWSPVDVGIVQATGIYASGHDDVFATGTGGLISHWDGSSWTLQDSGTVNALTGISGAAANDVFAVGEGDTILHYDGERWAPVRGPAGAQIRTVAATPTSVFFGGYGTGMHQLQRARP